MKTSSGKYIKAFLLAAGLGTRLRPITNTIPKCLVPIGGKPLLAHWMESLVEANICEALVNTHWLANKVESFANECKEYSTVINTFFEPELLGSAGTIAANADWATNADAVIVIYADNFSKIKLSQMVDFHFASNSELTLGVFTSPNPQRCGIVEIDTEGRGVSFEEKPDNPKSNLAAAGLYVLSPSIINEIKSMWLPGKGTFDLGFDAFPSLVKRSKIYRIDEPLVDIGTIEAYERVCSEYEFSFSPLNKN
jgi:NDP-sugar pyrophosphorylase family protein